MSYETIFPGLLTLGCNRFAFGAAQAVVHLPGKCYNPLWIYGPTGSGKTALLHAMCRQMQQLHPQLQIRYVQAEDFLRSHINAISGNYLPQFQEELARLDVLIVDHLNILYSNSFTQSSVAKLLAQTEARGCQVILASTRSPQEMRQLHLGLKHRCQWLLYVNIYAPVAQERLELTRTMARELKVPLARTMASRIAFAGRSPSRIRCLLTHLAARRQLLGMESGELSEALDQLITREVEV